MRKIYETAVILIGTLGWWGFVYPELCLTQDAYEQESEAQTNDWEEGDIKEQDVQAKESGQGGNFWEDGFKVGGLCIKSRAAEYVYQVKEKEIPEKE